MIRSARGDLDSSLSARAASTRRSRRSASVAATQPSRQSCERRPRERTVPSSWRHHCCTVRDVPVSGDRAFCALCVFCQDIMCERRRRVDCQRRLHEPQQIRHLAGPPPPLSEPRYCHCHFWQSPMLETLETNLRYLNYELPNYHGNIIQKNIALLTIVYIEIKIC